MYRECPICRNKFGGVLKGISMCLPEGNPLPTSYNVVACSQCGFTFADVNATQKDYDNYYSNYNVYSENNTLKVEDQEMEKEYDYLYGLMADKIDINAKILDVGCGSGDFLCFLKGKGFKNLCGLDPSEHSVKKLEEKGIRGIHGSIFEPVITEEKEMYDVVVSTAVMEHVYDVRTYVSHMIDYMRKDIKSHLLLLVPSVEGFEKHICAVPNYFNHEHINYFSKVSLDNLLHYFSFDRINDTVYFKDQNDEILLGALYEKSDEKFPLQYDDLSEKSIRNYFAQIQNMETALKQKINELLQMNKQIYMFGCGSYAMSIIKQYPALLKKIECFIDNNTIKQKQCICGKKVLPALSIRDSEDVVIAICSMLNAKDIERQIEQIAPKCLKVTL